MLVGLHDRFSMTVEPMRTAQLKRSDITVPHHQRDVEPAAELFRGIKGFRTHCLIMASPSADHGGGEWGHYQTMSPAPLIFRRIFASKPWPKTGNVSDDPLRFCSSGIVSGPSAPVAMEPNRLSACLCDGCPWYTTGVSRSTFFCKDCCNVPRGCGLTSRMPALRTLLRR